MPIARPVLTESPHLACAVIGVVLALVPVVGVISGAVLEL